jgi:hypothetical protein
MATHIALLLRHLSDGLETKFVDQYCGDFKKSLKAKCMPVFPFSIRLIVTES